MDAAGFLPGESVHVWNIQNGERLETYVIPAKRDSGEICLNRAAAR
jgi:aspartate 1-decarboxylase